MATSMRARLSKGAKVGLVISTQVLIACSTPAVKVNDLPWIPATLSKDGCPRDLSGTYRNASAQNVDEVRFMPEPMELVAGVLRQGSYVSPIETLFFAQVENQWLVASRMERPRHSGPKLMSVDEAQMQDEIAKQALNQAVELRKRKIADEREVEKRTGVRRSADPGIPLDQLPGVKERNVAVTAMTMSLLQKEDAVIYERRWRDGKLAEKVTVQLNTPMTGCRDGSLVLRKMSSRPAGETSGYVSFGEIEVRKLVDGSLQITERSRVQLLSSLNGEPRVSRILCKRRLS